jgi:hypothetical protein
VWVRRGVGEVDATALVVSGPIIRPGGKAWAPGGLGVAGCFLDELHAAGEAEFGVDVGEVGLHGAR